NNKTVKAVQEMQKSNVEELNQINNEISTSMTNIKRNLNETVKKAEQETRDLVSNAKHGALVTNIIDALKYGAATSAITRSEERRVGKECRYRGGWGEEEGERGGMSDRR